MRHRTWVEISAPALQHNVSELKRTLNPGVRFCAVVKANAYGHGLTEVVSVLKNENVELYGVDSVDEAMIVRSQNPNAVIFIMGATIPERLDDVVRGKMIQMVASLAELKAIRETARTLSIPAMITLEVETGLHRLGAEERELAGLLDELKFSCGLVYVVSVASHLSSAEDLSLAKVTAGQYDVFWKAVNEITRKGHQPEHLHIACSAAGIIHELNHGTHIRYGINLYGLWPSTDAKRAGTLGKRHADLKPVLSWKTSIAQVKDVHAGAAIGYGPTVIVNRLTRVAVLPVGYYDGFDRGFSNNGSVIIHGTRCPVLGRICMNMMMVDVSTVPGTLSPQTPVTLLGRDGVQTILADELAEKLGTINYEVVTRINPLLPRVIVG
ncbi:MAG: alanine racemase [Patescibacteria group bacterium]|jgi:alanine racemase